MIRLIHTCAQMHQWPVRCDASADGLLYPDPSATVCKVCYTMGAAEHDLPIAYRICPQCMAHYGILLNSTPRGLELPEMFPMLCQECGAKPNMYGDKGVVSLPLYAYYWRVQRFEFQQYQEEEQK